jgi:hypothetical protein
MKSYFQNWTANPQLTLSIPQSESELLYDWPFTANQFVLATSPLRITTSNCIFQLNTCGYSPYVTSSLMRWVCRLQLPLALASAVILMSESRWTQASCHNIKIQLSPSAHLHTQTPYDPLEHDQLLGLTREAYQSKVGNPSDLREVRFSRGPLLRLLSSGMCPRVFPIYIFMGTSSSDTGQIVIPSLEIYYIPFSTHDGNQNRRTGHSVEHTGLFFKRVPTERTTHPQRCFRDSVVW